MSPDVSIDRVAAAAGDDYHTGRVIAVEALEGTTGRPLIWATGQYLSYARPPSIMDIDVTVKARSRASRGRL